MGLFSRLRQLFRPSPPQVKLGIALGSGGAKGMAHLGALKAFEEAGITFSYVSGTSIGAVVGALLAKGYSSEDMRRIVEAVNRREFSRNLRPFADLTFAEQFLENYLEGDFTSLRLPFACCATDSKDNGLVVLQKGKLSRAVTASSAIPPLFKSVAIDGRELFDGAFTNAIPTDVCKVLGAEFVIGIDLAAFSKPEEEKGRFSRLLGSALTYIRPVHYTKDQRSRGYQSADYMLRPPLGAFRSTDISEAAMGEMYTLGYEEAKRCLGDIRISISNFSKARNSKRR